MILSSNQLRLLGRLLFLLIPYTLIRVGFYFYHLDTYRHFSQGDILESLLMGVRFDIAAICLINIPLIILALFPRINEKFERLCFILLNAVGFISSIDDYELFLFVGKRLSLGFFVITDDIVQQLPQLTLYYWYLPTVAMMGVVGYYFLDKKFFKSKQNFRPINYLSGILLMGLTFVGIRGGLQNKSINVQSAFVQGKNELGHLVLNTPYYFLRTLKNQRTERLTYFKQDSEAIELIKKHRSYDGDYKGMARANVVLIILESFSSEYLELGYAPFLSELKSKSLAFDRHLANGRRSIESLPSLFCGLPALLEEPISKSIFGGNKFTCFPQLLKQNGYTNDFYHAGSRGTMGFESYSLANGFDRYLAKEDYPDQGDFDGTWGIFDGPYLKYLAGEIDKKQEPFLTGVFTLSSHQPYKIPEKFKGRFPKGNLEIHETVGYTDFALREFFDSIKGKPWFNRTLFVITGDHSQKLETKKYLNLVGTYRVPFILYAPGHEWKVTNNNKVTQHSDIPKTILDFVEINGDGLPAITNSAFTAEEGIAFNYSDGTRYLMIEGEKLYKLDKSGKLNYSTYNWETGAAGPEEANKDPILKASLQYFLNGLLSNNLSLYR